ncbi:phytanoyl-CoA dioxygenase family protein [Paenibacillus sp. CC-CFT747]|nr:phytanoyl-CoA dioxygenase family protein [Paenibacillus sp. CC-CFT747]
MAASTKITVEDKRHYDEEGFLVVKGLVSAEEAEGLREHFMKLQAGGPIPGCFSPVPEEEAKDILQRYPRMMHPHKVDELSMKMMLDGRILDVLRELLEEEPLAAQSMFYFKPPGAKGQALHQDNFYLKVEPGTCIAAWIAVDDADEENGGMFLVPKSNALEVLCPHLADPAVSFTRDEVDVPDGLHPVPARMKAGDVLFFNGSMIHGSYPNTSEDRFRRAFICHYTGISTTRIGQYYTPLYEASGQPIDRDANPTSGPCGTEHNQGGVYQPH